jgi:hypothetical protein
MNRDKNPKFEEAEEKYNTLYNEYQDLLDKYGENDERVIKALHEQARAYWKWKSTPEFSKDTK